ncbi:MAG: SpoIID/LytB domain-containing protein [Dysgonamonadaceae bacterium]|jgi:SpoIID/LytB domain protein|nr:SpoIID/LytB domain-containing protein [Dysgonamonadaceae bacterium]
MSKPLITVGILSSPVIRFRLNGVFNCVNLREPVEGDGEISILGNNQLSLQFHHTQAEVGDSFILEPVDETCDFELFDVTIGLRFHWERKENQRFKGALKFIVEEEQVTAVNVLPLEDYLLSVISSEMSATSSLEFLKTHAVISRSWLLAQQEKCSKLKSVEDYRSFLPETDGYIRWYDREAHVHYDVCADDHCQRYQGITKISTHHVREALKQTEGEVLTYNHAICDARFSKCCGGITESFENVWEPVAHPYLANIMDGDAISPFPLPDLTNEQEAEKWISTTPDVFCNTSDKRILEQVLNDYDRETPDFFRWQTTWTQHEIKDLLFRKTGVDFGDIIDLIPVERGPSGRLIRLKIVGSKQSLIIGKELEIRKVLSESHLYSAAFIVEKTLAESGLPEKFILKGAGWGHGVGLCQIGAAVMGNQGYSYREILQHYFPGAKIERINN